MKITLSSWAAIAPELVLLIGAMLLMLLGAYKKDRQWGLVTTFCTLLLAGLMINPAKGGYFPYEGALSHLHNDYFTCFFFALFLMVAAITSILAVRYLDEHESLHGEFFAMLLFTTIGMMIMASSRDLLVMYLGLELMSIAAYVLAAYLSPQRRSLEAGIKYFLTGALGSAIFLFGVAYLYGATGSLGFAQIGNVAVTKLTETPFFAIGATFLLAGFAFKVAAVPFHMWAPDVYEGAPTPVTAFMAVGIKAAAFSVLARVVIGSLDIGHNYWFDLLLGGLCAGTMIWGNVAAIAQRSLKRMLAYSSLAHAGYLLLAITARSDWSGPALLFYLFAYSLMNLGAFAVLIAFEKVNGKQIDIESYAGLGARYPVLALTLTIFMFSLAGIPPTIGFIGKWYIFGSAIMKGGSLLITLAVLGVMSSLVSVYYYMRVVYFMYMLRPHENTANIDSPRPAEQKVATVLCVAVLVLGILPPLHLVKHGTITKVARLNAARIGTANQAVVPRRAAAPYHIKVTTTPPSAPTPHITRRVVPATREPVPTAPPVRVQAPPRRPTSVKLPKAPVQPPARPVQPPKVPVQAPTRPVPVQTRKTAAPTTKPVAPALRRLAPRKPVPSTRPAASQPTQRR